MFPPSSDRIDAGWKAGLQIPPKDNRIKTSVSKTISKLRYEHCLNYNDLSFYLNFPNSLYLNFEP